MLLILSIIIFQNLFLNSIVSASLVQINEEVIASTKFGRLRGLVLNNENKDASQRVNVFLGIPFAKPPLGDLRFEKPQGPDAWPNTLVKNMTEFAPACLPHHRGALYEGFVFSEDCLYLNIIAPGWARKSHELFPVLFYIHGGGFEIGSALHMPYDFLAEHYALKGVIIVTIQYRLGPLGFASNGDDANFGGNLGLWDQVEALKYVRSNIKSFGGDPDRITICGNSAGGASVSALSHSTHSRELFSQSIQMSGSIYTEWAFSEQVINETRAFAEVLECGYFEYTEGLKKCLKSKSVDQILDAVDKIDPTRYDMNLVKFQPRFDHDFFSEDPTVLIEEAPSKPTMLGVTENEAIFFTLFNKAETIHKFGIEKKDFKSFDRKKFDYFLANAVASEDEFGKDQAKVVQRKISKYYLKNETEDSDYKFYLDKYGEVISDLAFVMPVLFEADLKAAKNSPVFLYLLDYYNKDAYPQDIPIKGCFHAIELTYLFNHQICFMIDEFNKDDLAFQSNFINAIIQFASDGNPSTDQLKWPPIGQKNNKLKPYMLLNSSPKVVESPLMLEKLEFWESLRDEFKFDFTRGMKVQKFMEKKREEL